MKNYFKKLFGEGKPKAFMFTTRHLGEQTGNGERISREAHSPANNWVVVNEFITGDTATSVGYGSNAYGMSTTPGASKTAPKVDERKEVKPIEVFNEIKKEGLEPDFSRLDEKIKAIEDRIEILKEHLKDEHLTDEHKALFFLKNRRTYANKTMKKYPLDWAMTNREAIDDLCKRYKLQTVPLKQYYTLVPNDGIKEMNRYSKAYEAITGDKPIFELIIKTEEAKPEEKKERTKKDRDPILVANSPLGDFMFVLGAWDEEVEFVDEIIYEGK
jgi:hypothetical protein